MSSKVKSPTATGGEATMVPKLRFPEFRRADVWKETSLAKVLSPVAREKVKPSQSYTGLGLRSHGKGTFLKEQEDPAKNAMVVLYEVKRNDLIVNITFAWEGAIAIAGRSDDGALVSHRFPTYTFEKGQALPEFFKYKVLDKHFVYSLGVISPGGAGRNRVMSKTDFLKLTVLLPKTDEQQKIADCLDSADALIAAQGRKVEALRAHKRGLMQQLFPQEGETQPRLRFPEFRDGAEWEEKSLATIIDLISGMHLSPDDYSSTGEVPYFTGPSDFTNDVRKVTKWTKLKANASKAEDLLITVKGSGVGEVWFSTLPMVAMGRQLMAVRAKRGANPLYIFQFLLTKKSRFEDLGSGNLIPGLSRGDLLELKVCFPSLLEQQRIAVCLTSLDDLIAAEAQKLDRLKTHKKGLMQQLFPEVGKSNA